MEKKRNFNQKLLQKSLVKWGTLALVLVSSGYSTGAQNYSNYGYNSENYETATDGAATLEYDNFISGFHSTIIRGHDGVFRIWGECTRPNGVDHFLVPTAIDRVSFPQLTGIPVRAALGSNNIVSTNTGPQHFLLTSDNKIWAWGKEGIVVDNALTSSTQFQQLAIGLPPGVTASQVKMMFATRNALVITTTASNGGAVWVLSAYAQLRGVGSAASDALSWSKVQKSTGGDLTGIVAVRGYASETLINGLVALGQDGSLWTWGTRTLLGNNSSTSSRNLATPMTNPYTGSPVKMIGMTRGEAAPVYYLLYEDGRLYAMGDNSDKQLGDFQPVNSGVNPNWTRPRYSSAATDFMNDIAWISPQEHDGSSYTSINVINKNKVLWNWGINAHKMLGRQTAGNINAVDPGQPELWQSGYSNTNIIATETGGHTTMLLKECSQNFGYIGHRINGSMGDNDPNEDAGQGADVTVRFNTAAISVEGVNTGAAVLYPVSGEIAVGVPTQLSFSPAGGVFSITGGSGTVTQQGELTGTAVGTVTVSYTVTGACSAPTTSTITVNVTTSLSASFGSIQAELTGNTLAIHWLTLNEKNNSHFDIEVSPDGANFSKIGEVKSSAQDGNSDDTLNYSFEGVASSGATLGLGLCILAIGGLAFRRKGILAAMIFIAGTAFCVAGCKKINEAGVDRGELFVRIAQVDKDGTKSYSKVVKTMKR